MGKLYIISEDSLKNMKENIQINMESYKNGTYSLEGVEKRELIGLSIDDDLNDKMVKSIETESGKPNLFKCACTLHKALDISPLLASNESLWVFLTHGPLQGFVHKVWDFSQLNEKQSEDNYVKQHWFIENQSELMRNALASLWWGVEISKIEVSNKDEDPYRLTEILFKNYTLRVVSLAQVLRMRNVLRGILEWIYKHNDIKSLENQGKFMAKYLNQLAGIKQLSILSHDDIYKLLDEVKDVIYKIRNRKDVDTLTVAEIIYNFRNEQQ